MFGVGRFPQPSSSPESCHKRDMNLLFPANLRSVFNSIQSTAAISNFLRQSKAALLTSSFSSAGFVSRLQQQQAQASSPSNASSSEEPSGLFNNPFIMLTRRLTQNLSIYWIAASSLCIWFLFVHSPSFLRKRQVFTRPDIPLATHLVGAYTIYLACLLNTLWTPSIVGRSWHVWVGRVAMVVGILSFAFGLYCAWWPYRLVRPPLAFSTGITIGGMAQIATQRAGYLAIQKYHQMTKQQQEYAIAPASKKDDTIQKLWTELEAKRQSELKKHIFNMIALYLAACGIPAGLRIADLLPENLRIVGTIAAIAGLQVLVTPFARTYLRKNQSSN